MIPYKVMRIIVGILLLALIIFAPGLAVQYRIIMVVLTLGIWLQPQNLANNSDKKEK